METILNITTIILVAFFAVLGVFTLAAIFKAILVALGIHKD